MMQLKSWLAKDDFIESKQQSDKIYQDLRLNLVSFSELLDRAQRHYIEQLKNRTIENLKNFVVNQEKFNKCKAIEEEHERALQYLLTLQGDGTRAEKDLKSFEMRAYPADQLMTASGAEYKVINSLPMLLTSLADFVRQVYCELPSSKSNFPEGANGIIEVIRMYN